MKNLFPYIYDFLSLLFEDDKIRNMIKRVVLFGSAARNEADKESDIDLFIDVWAKNQIKEVESYSREADKRFYLISGKKWALLGIEHPIKYIVGLLEEDRWKELRLEIAGYGILLYGKYEEQEGNLKHCAIFSYSLSKLSQRKKMEFLRKLFGYKIMKGKKQYSQSGLLDEISGKKLGANIILVPVEKSREISDFLNSFGITPEIRDARIK